MSRTRFSPIDNAQGFISRSSRSIRIASLVVLTVSGCVSESQYETVANEMNRLRTELRQAQADVKELEDQREALSRLKSEGEKLLTGIRAELQQARIAYAEYQAEHDRLEALKEKARALQNEHAKHQEGIKAAKRAERKMQAVIDRYEREIGRVPDIGDMLRVSQAGEPNGSNSQVVATVTPVLSDSHAPTPRTAPDPTPSPATAAAPAAVDAPRTATAQSATQASAGTPSPAPPAASPATGAPVAAASPAPKPGPATVPMAGSKPPSQPIPADDSWLASLTGWWTTFWNWLFS